jgi:imidazolonepropionase
VTAGVIFAPAVVTPEGHGPRRGADLADVRVVKNAALAWKNGAIVWLGPEAELPREFVPVADKRARRVGGAVIPGFVDCHTHLPFVGWRAGEFEARLAGRTYADVQGGGGGIFRSRRLLAEAGDDQVLDFCVPLAEEMLAGGTTALELKTGYGLSVGGELRQARLARRLAAEIPQEATVTLLSCHAVPEEYERAAWVDTVCREILPAAAAEGLIDMVDIYVEDIAFTVQDLRRVAEAAGEAGLPFRCHADQLGASGAAEAAVALGSRSADHLNYVSAEGVEALGRAEGTAAVLLPASSLFIREQAPPALDLVEAGAVVALATDFNPGTSPCLSMPEMLSVASSLYRMTPRAALSASTLNAAWVLGLHERHGSLEPGKRADFVVLDSDDVAMIPYRPGHNPVTEVWLAGSRVA